MTTLLADIGGTNTRCAIRVDGQPAGIREFRNQEFAGLTDLLSAYLDTLAPELRPQHGAFAVAAPIRADAVHMINIDWQFSQQELRQSLRLDSLQLMNDFEALAWALPVLTDADRLQVGGGTAVAGQPMGVLGPGTGLGVAGLVHSDTGWLAVPGEGGHVTLPASDELEAALIARARTRLGHCSAERLISGPGLTLIHALRTGSEVMPATALAKLIDDGDADAVASLETMFRLLGTVAADLALTLGAFGGIYIGGGIVPRYAERFARSGFRDRFEDKGRYRDYLGEIPTWLITATNPALLGLSAWAGNRRREPA